MKFTYKRVGENREKNILFILYTPEDVTLTPFQFEISIPPHVLRLSGEDQAQALHELIMRYAPLDGWNTEQARADRVTQEFTVPDDFCIDPVETTTETVATFRADTSAIVRGEWSDSMMEIRKQFKANKGTMTKAELAQFMRDVIQNNNIEYNLRFPKKKVGV